MYFGGNEVSRNLISLSPLPSAHPSCFQPTPVRASSRCYPTFALAQGRSPRFAFTPSNWLARRAQRAASSPEPFQVQGYHLLWPAFPRRSPTAGIDDSTHAVLQPPASP